MKVLKIIFIAPIFLCVLSCSNNDNSKVKVNDDPAHITVPDNNSANNPSLADTAYGKKDSTIKKEK